MNLLGMPNVEFTPTEPPVARGWEQAEIAPLFEVSTHGLCCVLGGPGTGKTSLLIDIAVAQLARGRAADDVLIVAQSKEAATRMRVELAARIAELDNSVAAGAGGMVRAVHSLAFAIVRDGAVSRGTEPPSLTTGARQDSIVRQLLRGHSEEGGAYWPPRLQAALKFQGMARSVRDFLLRAAERGVDAHRLEQLSAEFNVPEWRAAGEFMREYRQTMRLAGQEDLNAAELISAALKELESNESLLDSWSKKLVLIDDAEHLSPQAAQLLRAFVDRADLAVITGDEDQSVLHFRGASNDFLREVGVAADTRIVLQNSYRCAAEIARLSNSITTRLPKAPSYRGITSMADDDCAIAEAAGSVRVVIHPTPALERASIADFLRRLHTEENVPWRDMAVIVRSGAGESPLHRALSRAGVPIYVDPTDIVLGEQRMVKALLLALQALTDELTAMQWEQFLTGPLVNADSVTLARLMRGIRRTDLTGVPAMERIVTLLSSASLSESDSELLESLPEREREVLKKPLALLNAGRSARSQGVEATLWAIWQESGLSDHLRATSMRGGAAGATADRDLDAVMTFFDFAGDLVEQNSKLTLTGLIAAVNEQELPIGARDRRTTLPDAVNIISAHAALGREWEAVAVAGIQEGLWPSLGATGSIMRQEEFIALMDDGITPGEPISYLSAQLAEERRLLNVAVSRARRAVLLTATDDADITGAPSPFMYEIGKAFSLEEVTQAPLASDSEDANSRGADEERNHSDELSPVYVAPSRVLSIESLLAELRAAVVDPDQTPVRRRQAARQLARMAEADIAGADPDDWWGLAAPSTTEPADSREQVTIHPSAVEKTLQCPLKAVLEPRVSTPAMSLGTMFHLATEALDAGATIEEVSEQIRRVYPIIADVPEWRLEQDIDGWIAALNAWQQWYTTQQGIAAEVPVSVSIDNTIAIRGRIDRLIDDGSGAMQIADIKTSKTAASKDEANEHAQLATYQVALAHGQLVSTDGEPQIVNGNGIEQSGAYLVYPRDRLAKGNAKVRVQEKFTEEKLEQWTETIRQVAKAIRGPKALALAGTHCQYCSLIQACPAQEGAR